MDDDYQTEVMRSKLTPNIAVTFKEARVFVGVPLCLYVRSHSPVLRFSC
jgi:hypothetical protein